MVQYQASLFIWMIGQVLEPLVYLIVWSTVSNGSGGSVGGYTQGFAGYYLAHAGQPGHLYLGHVRVSPC